MFLDEEYISAKTTQVIEVTKVVGDGTADNPKRIVALFYALDGSYLGTTDPKYEPYVRKETYME
jgi:hypothetical protein